MAAEREHSGELSDARLEHLLKVAHDVPKLDDAFVDALSKKLDREFAQPAEVQQSIGWDSSPSNNGASQAGWVNTKADDPLPASEAKPRSAFHRSRWRLAVIFGTAASLLVATTLWNSPPAYGWAAMLRALEQCAWVQTVASNEGVSGWASASQGIVAAQSATRTVFRDDRQAMGADYRAEEQTITQKSLESRNATSWEVRLLALLLSDVDEIGAILNDAPQGWELVSESWKLVENKAGHDRLVQLRVKLRAIGEEAKTVELEFLLDPATHLPISGRVLKDVTLEDANFEDAVFEFAYPEQGPTTIFALGVSPEAKLITPSGAKTISAQLGAIGKKESGSEAIDAVVKSEITSPALDLSISPHESTDWDVSAEPLSSRELVEQLNAMLTAYWESQGVHPAELATDAEFLRRVYLDLTGRIPMVSEAYQFLEDPSPDRRTRLVDELLASRDHATHLATVWRTMLLPEGVDLQAFGGTAKFDEWLADRFAQNLPYDQLVSQLLSAEGRVSESGPLLFYAALKLNPEELASKTSRVFLGTRMGCAQCHDHPFDDEISQEDFWGFAAFFAQISRPQGKMEVTSRVLRVRDNARGEVMLPDTEEVIAPHLPGAGQGEDFIQSKKALSRRRQLVAWLTSRDNRRFSSSAVNRVWAHLFGRGLVDPVDDLRVDNAPVIPEAMEFLSQDFAASGFDLRRLLRTLVLSEAYQLSSRADVEEPSQTLLFARMNLKSMTADQLYDCIAVSTQNAAMSLESTENGALARFSNTSRQAFIVQFQAPPGERTNYHAGIPQALTLLHGQIIHGATDLETSGLLKSLGAPFFSDQQRIETLFLATLSRLPNGEEQRKMFEYVGAAKDEAERMQAMGDVLWALLNSAEFTFIH